MKGTNRQSSFHTRLRVAVALCCAVAVLGAAAARTVPGAGRSAETPFLALEQHCVVQRRRRVVQPGEVLLDRLLVGTGVMLASVVLLGVDLRAVPLLCVAGLHWWALPEARRVAYGSCQTLGHLLEVMEALDRLETRLVTAGLLAQIAVLVVGAGLEAGPAVGILAARPRTLVDARLKSTRRDGVVDLHRVGTAHTEEHWVIELRRPLTLRIPRDDPDFADILMVILYEARDEEGGRFLDQATIGRLFRLSRQMTNARVALYKRRRRIEDVLSRQWHQHALTPQILEAIHEMVLRDPFIGVTEIHRRLLEAGRVPPRGDISLETIKKAVAEVDFIEVRRRLKRLLKRGEVVPNHEKLCQLLLRELEELAEVSGRDLGQHILSAAELLGEQPRPSRRAPPEPARVPSPALEGREGSVAEEGLETGEAARMSFLIYFAFGATYREVATFLGVHASTVYRRFQSLRRRLPELQRLLGALRYSGIVAVDEKYVLAPKPAREGKMARWVYLFVAIDPLTYDLLHAQVYPERTREAAKAFLLGLKARGVLTPKVVVTDLWKPYESVVLEVFPRCTHHQCVFHAEQAASELMRDRLGPDYRSVPAAAALRWALVELFRSGSRRTLVRRYKKLLEEKPILLSGCPELTAVYDSLARHFGKLANAYSDRGLSIPKTNNAVERVIRTFTRRYKTMAGFERIETARAYIELWSWYYRFRPFSPDARPRIRNRSPLQLAGYDVDGLSCFDLARSPPKARGTEDPAVSAHLILAEPGRAPPQTPVLN